MPKIIYIHVPKCGGSSFAAALKILFAFRHGTIGLNQIGPGLTGEAAILSDYQARARQLQQHVQAGKFLISGHVQYDPDLHSGAARDYRFVTMLRDPAERFVSHYNYLQRKHPSPDRPDTLAAFLDTNDAHRLASQYLFYFAGVTQNRTDDVSAAIARAIRNLGKFDLIGELSEPDAFVRDLGALSGTRVPQLRRNTAPQKTHIPSELREQIDALCAVDQAIYTAVALRRNAA